MDRLGTVDDIPGVRELIVPNGIFKSTRSTKKNKSDEAGRPVDKSKLPSTVTRTFAPFPQATPSPTCYPTSNPNQPNGAPSQQPHSSSSQYPEHPAYNQYYQTQAQSPQLSTSEFFNQAIRTPGHESAHGLPTIPASQAHYLQQASPKHEIYAKEIDESPYISYMSMPRNVPAPYALARFANEMEHTAQGPTYTRAPSTDSPLHPMTSPRGYEPTSYDIHGTNGMENQNYVFGLPGSMISDPASHPLPYSDTDNSGQSPNLPPRHVVERIRASVDAMATPNDAARPGEGRKPTVGPNRHLAPLQSLTRPCPYRRDSLDDKTLRLLRPRD